MKVAIDKNGNLAYINQASTNQSFFCPECHQPLIVKTSKKGRKYFAHYNRKVNHQGETSEHLTGKSQIYEWAKQNGWHPQLEVSLPLIDQRADILCQIGTQVVAIEFQCSPLSVKAITARNQGYRLSGIQCYWFLGQRYLKHLHTNKIAQFTHWYQNQPVLYFWNINSGNLNIKQINYYNYCKHREKIEINLLNRYCKNNANRRQLANLAYQHGHILCCCPLFVHDINIRLPLMEEEIVEWRISSLLALETYTVHSWFSLQQWRQFLIMLGHWNPFPCISKDNFQQMQNNLIQEWTMILKKQGIIEIHNNRCVIKKRALWFDTVEQKLAILNKRLVK